MSRKSKGNEAPKPPQLPLDALSKVSLGDSFAEYDMLVNDPRIFVETNAFIAANDPSRNKCFFIGRRGTGKTALTIQLNRLPGTSIQIFPEVFAPLNTAINPELFTQSRQKPFKSVVSAFELTLGFELLYELLNTGKIDRDQLPDFVQRELKIEDNKDFDLRAVRFVHRIISHLEKGNDGSWIKDIKRAKQLAAALNTELELPNKSYTILIDRIDESWDGSDINVRFLAALMHACGEFTTRVNAGRALLFLRENVFERVREFDSEFSRLETRVVGLTWTVEKLVELIERRLNAPFNSRWQIGGPTWNTFFESSDHAKSLVFDFCQNRPRDVLTYVKFAIENAASKNHHLVQIDDLLTARKRFSDSRLKELGDEYDENFPRVQLVLEKFYGLGWRLTRQGLETILKNLISDKEIARHCASWFFANSSTEQFVSVLFQIGFLGLIDERGNTQYRAIGAETTRTPAISSATDFEIHPMYRDALDLRDLIVNVSPADFQFGTRGSQSDLPDGLDLGSYADQLAEIEEDMPLLKPGRPDAADFEDLVGRIIKLCFFRSLANIQPKSRSFEGHVIRDWLVSNRGYGGFWEMVRHKYGATQIIWECKNYVELKADDFHQMAYYTNEDIGRFGIVAFRGTILPSYMSHLKDILKNKKTFVLLLGESDLRVFVRQAKAGKVKESHIQDRFDYVLRAIG